MFLWVTSGEGAINKNRKVDKYHLILEAAIVVFARNGFFQSTVSQIAREAGVADGTIYLYFKNKDDILVEFFTYKIKQVFERFREKIEEGDTAEEKLRNLVTCHLEEFQKDVNMAQVFQMEARQIRHMEDHTKQISKMYFSMIGDIVEQGQDEGCMRKDLYIGLVKRYIFGAIDEVINTWVVNGGKYDLLSMADPLVDLCINGIGVKAP